MSPKINNVGFFFGGGLDTSKNPKIMKMRVFGASHNKIEKLLDQKIDENNSPEL